MRSQEQEHQPMHPLSHEQARHYLHVGQDQLVAAEQIALNTHLARCLDCRRYASEVADLQRRMAEVMYRRWGEYSPSPAINGAVQARLRRTIPQAPPWRAVSSFAAVAATLILIVAVGWLARDTRSLLNRPLVSATIAAPASPRPSAPLAGDWATLPGLAVFSDRAKLLGYSLAATTFSPGDTVNIALYSQVRSGNYTFFVRLLDSKGATVAQTDTPGTADDCSQVTRHAADLAVICVPMVLPTTLPAGSYQLQVGVVDQANGRRLLTPARDETVLLAILQVGARPEEDQS